MGTSESKSLHEAIADRLRDVPRSGIRDFFDIVSTMHDVVSLSIGEPDFDTPWHVRESAIFALEKGVTGYTGNHGLPKVREAIADYAQQTFGVQYDPADEILITVGVSEALDLAVRALVNPGDEILYHEPCYVSYRPIITLAHGTPVAVETDADNGFRLTREALEEKVTDRTKAIILNYPNNPTGAVLEPAEVEQIASFVQDHDLLVITDEIYAELTYDRKHLSLAALPGMKERTIFLHGFSKAWAMTGFRIGYAAAPASILEAMLKIHQYTMLCAPILSQEAALEALTHPDSDIAQMRSAYVRHRNYMHGAFTDLGRVCEMPRGAFYMFPYIGDLGLSSKDFAYRLLEEEKVAVVPGSAFGECGEGYIRCSFATRIDEIKIAMERIGRFVNRCLKRIPQQSKRAG